MHVRSGSTIPASINRQAEYNPPGPAPATTRSLHRSGSNSDLAASITIKARAMKQRRRRAMPATNMRLSLLEGRSSNSLRLMVKNSNNSRRRFRPSVEARRAAAFLLTESGIMKMGGWCWVRSKRHSLLWLRTDSRLWFTKSLFSSVAYGVLTDTAVASFHINNFVRHMIAQCRRGGKGGESLHCYYYYYWAILIIRFEVRKAVGRQIITIRNGVGRCRAIRLY